MVFIKKLKPFHEDERGTMTHLLDGKIKIIGALLVTCKKGAIRANHYHTHDIHYSYMLKGSMRYVYQDLRKKGVKKRSAIVRAGHIVETLPMTAHAMLFLEDSIFLALTTEKRDQSSYESDTVRVTLIPPK